MIFLAELAFKSDRLLAIPMKKGSMQRFVLHLPSRTEAQWCTVWFWLQKGVIEISDVRIK